MMKALIVEDERMAQMHLSRLLHDHFPDIEVVGTAASVRDAVALLSAGLSPDLIFMDVELSDGECFEIFRQVEVKAKVIMTTAYESYALKAFETGSIDYLLKPVGIEALTRAVNRCRERAGGLDVQRLLEAVGRTRRQYKERSVVRVGDQILPIRVAEIAYFFSEDKSNFLMLHRGGRFLIESTLDALESELDPDSFFRISRSCIVSRQAVRSMSRHLSGRLLLDVTPVPPFEMTVSRARVEDFLAWFE